MDTVAMMRVAGEILLITKGIAWSFLLLLFVIQVIFTLTKGIGGEKIEHALSLKSLLFVAAFLVFYGQFFEWVLNISNDVIDQIIPPDFMAEFDKKFAKALEKQDQGSSQRGFLLTFIMVGPTGAVADILLQIALILMRVSFEMLRWLSHLARSFLYIIGPLVVVTHVVPGASVVSGWVRSVIEVSMWPVVSGVFYRLLAEGILAKMESQAVGDYFSFLAMCLIVVIVNIFTPLIVNYLSNNKGIGGVGTWAVGAFAVGATKGLALAKLGTKRGIDLYGKAKGENKERRPGEKGL